MQIQKEEHKKCNLLVIEADIFKLEQEFLSAYLHSRRPLHTNKIGKNTLMYKNG